MGRDRLVLGSRLDDVVVGWVEVGFLYCGKLVCLLFREGILGDVADGHDHVVLAGDEVVRELVISDLPVGEGIEGWLGADGAGAVPRVGFLVGLIGGFRGGSAEGGHGGSIAKEFNTILSN